MMRENKLSFINLPNLILIRLCGGILLNDFKIFLENCGLMYHNSVGQHYVTYMIVNPEKFMLFKIKHGDILENTAYEFCSENL